MTRLSDEQIGELFAAMSGACHLAPAHFAWMADALHELRARRAADLSPEDVEAVVEAAVDWVRERRGPDWDYDLALRVAVDRLLAANEGKP